MKKEHDDLERIVTMSSRMAGGGGKSSNFRPSLTRAETIESCNSDDLVTVLEMHNRKPYKIMDRKRETKKGVMAESLEELISRGMAKLNYTLDKKVYVVLEEDGTEVDEEEYFQTLPSNTLLMLLYVGDRWSPYGAPFTAQQNNSAASGKRIHLTTTTSSNSGGSAKATTTKTASSTTTTSASGHAANDETDYRSNLSSGLLSRGQSFDLVTLLDRLYQDIGSIVLFSGRELEVLSEFDPDELTYKYDLEFLQQIQEAADRHLKEKREIRDALGLLKIYHNAAKNSKNSSKQSNNVVAADDPNNSVPVRNNSESTSKGSPTKRKRGHGHGRNVKNK